MATKANLHRTTITVPKNSGTQTVTYSSLSMNDGRVYLITAMTASNNAWRYAGLLFLQSTRTLLVDLATSSYLTAAADSTELTFTNTSTSYDANVIVQVIGY